MVGRWLWTAPDCRTDWWRSTVVYQRSFQDTEGGEVGDLVGMERWVNCLVDLGADSAPAPVPPLGATSPTTGEHSTNPAMTLGPDQDRVSLG